jgi:hypothetical protein
MDLLKYRNEKDKKNEELIKKILDEEVAQRYRFGSIAEMALIRELMLDKIMKGKLKSQEELQKYDNIKESLKEYFYVEKMEQIEASDYIRYLTFNNKDEFELKKGGFFVNMKDGFIVLKNGDAADKKGFWKISDKTPLFCKLDDNDKLVLVLMEQNPF